MASSSFDRQKANEMAERQKALGYVPVKVTRTFRLESPVTEGIRLIASYGGWNFPGDSMVHTLPNRILPPCKRNPVCVLVGRSLEMGEGPSMLASQGAIREAVRFALARYREDDGHKPPSDKRLPTILKRLDDALGKLGLPPITGEMPAINRMVLFPSTVISRLAGLLAFEKDERGVCCTVTNVSLNGVHIATNPPAPSIDFPFVDFSYTGFITVGKW
ncbi:MAG: hypothetical protein PHV13_05110 [Candidatus ainarchaeum sp.]|nr:hypothetical protein [Candidatus ainarchaeum sp.]